MIDVRAGRPDDADQLGPLNGARNGAWTDGWVRALLADDDVAARWRVAADGDRVAAAAVLLPADWRLDGVDLGATQVEFVATDPDYEHQGLMRRVMGALHELAAEEGGLVQLLTGIPYFYRQLGYEYAVADFDRRVLTTVPAMPAGWTVRPATLAEVPVIEALDAPEADRTGAALRGGRPAAQWPWLFASPGFQVLLAIDPDGTPRASTRTFADAGLRFTMEHAAADPDGTRALLAHVPGMGPERVVAAGRRGTIAGGVLDALTEPDPTKNAYPLAVRVGDPVALLDRLRPVLDRRLEAAGLGEVSRRFTLTAYRWTARVAIEDGHVVSVERGPGQQDPFAADTVGVPPDLMATLLLGERSASQLEATYPDVVLGEHRGFADVLFPGVTSDAWAY